MALHDHNYVIPANHAEEEKVGVSNIHLQDHTYVQQLPIAQIQPQQEADRSIQNKEYEKKPVQQEEKEPVHQEEQREPDMKNQHIKMKKN
ncbi:Hypothetical protein CINCED_3A014531 [Cinara cedri]|uniref:Uncharacterized protein n=1 Tax=Cinara cedri TaxID=506608 RepID=A0A5E4MFS0_9HEMI|nr:Hypothetical protein CINCED_3A014531 [Cinara cedri]